MGGEILNERWLGVEIYRTFGSAGAPADIYGALLNHRSKLLAENERLREALTKAELVCEAASKHRESAINAGIPWADYFANTESLDSALDAWIKARAALADQKESGRAEA
jgi:hypothetical protein